jgi:DNA-directed RNA polymerase subunit RPC12/RpoP
MEQEEQFSLWASDPERMDPDDYRPGSAFARQITWAPCAACRLQVHLPVSQVVYQGIVCPRCGTRLLHPPEDPEDWLRRVLREEDDLSEQL